MSLVKFAYTTTIFATHEKESLFKMLRGLPSVNVEMLGQPWLWQTIYTLTNILPHINWSSFKNWFIFKLLIVT